ncbi:DUF1045 domain-containing protein [Mesorhizobium escarrei]|uniref:Uncharacterized protein n=1 Tax=Mesorhizobium escarrei TaxID=666018 RepID=A0ABN8JWW1_9HYPH|nr:hypothetical protein MES5069_310092 [Mesorhizobium escarrei]
MDFTPPLRDFADGALPCPSGRLRIGMIGGFFALVPAGPMAFLRGFASRIVREFDGFRAPMNQSEPQRRMRRLTPVAAARLRSRNSKRSGSQAATGMVLDMIFE